MSKSHEKLYTNNKIVKSIVSGFEWSVAQNSLHLTDQDSRGEGGGEAALPIMAYTGRLFLEGIPFQASDISKVREFTS